MEKVFQEIKMRIFSGGPQKQIAGQNKHCTLNQNSQERFKTIIKQQRDGEYECGTLTFYDKQ